MRKIPLALLTLAALASWGARAEETAQPQEKQTAQDDKQVVVAVADDDVAQGETPPAATPAPAAAPAPAPATATNAVAAPSPAAAVEAKADDKTKEEGKNKFPLHANIGLDNSLGEGILQNRGNGVSVPVQGGDAPTLDFPATQPDTQISTSLSLGGSASLPKIEGVGKFGLSTGMSISMPNWVASYGNGSAFEHELQLSDIRVGTSFSSDLLKEEFTKISASPSLSVRLPVSLGSRQRKIITGVSTGVGFSWESPEASWGQVGVHYNPGLSFNLYYGDAPTARNAVGDGAVGNNVPVDPVTGQVLPLAYCRTTEQLAATGECELAGRRGVASINNTVGVSWSLGNHEVGVSMGFGHSFLAANPPDTLPNEHSQFSSQQNFSESSNGSISYSYNVPADLTGAAHVSLSFGLGSGGPAWFVGDDGQQYLRFPFWNFDHVGTNMSSASFGISVGI